MSFHHHHHHAHSAGTSTERSALLQERLSSLGDAGDMTTQQLLDFMVEMNRANMVAIQSLSLKTDVAFGKIQQQLVAVSASLQQQSVVEGGIYQNMQNIPGIMDGSPFVKTILAPLDQTPVNSAMGNLLATKVSQAAAQGLASYGFPTMTQNAIYLVLEAINATTGFNNGLNYDPSHMVFLSEQDIRNITPMLETILLGNYKVPAMYGNVYLYALALIVKGLIKNEFSATAFPQLHL